MDNEPKTLDAEPKHMDHEPEHEYTPKHAIHDAGSPDAYESPDVKALPTDTDKPEPDEPVRKEIDPPETNEPDSGDDGDEDLKEPVKPEKKHEGLLVSAVKGALAGAHLGGLNSVFNDHDEALNEENHQAKIDYDHEKSEYEKKLDDKDAELDDEKEEQRAGEAEDGKRIMTNLGYQGDKASDDTARDFLNGKEAADAKDAKRGSGLKRSFLDKVDEMRGVNPNEYSINTGDGSKFAYNPQTLRGGDHELPNGKLAETKNGYTGQSNFR